MATIDEVLARARQTRELPRVEVRRALRVAAGLSQQDVASVLGVDRATVARWELGAREPRGERAVRYAAVLLRLKEAVRG